MKNVLCKICNWMDTWWPNLLAVILFAASWWILYILQDGQFPDWLMNWLAG